jgi:hypothetical protein
VKNICRFIRRAPREFSIYLERRVRGKWTDLRVMAWTRAGYEQYLRGVYEKLNEHSPDKKILRSEQLMCSVVDSWGRRDDLVTLWNTEPYIDGIQAYNNVNWSEGRNLRVFYMRSIIRRLAPSFL